MTIIEKSSQEKELFRTNALKNLNAIDSIQNSLQVITPGSWTWMFMAFFTLAGLALWGLLGEISITVQTNGIILPENSQVLPIVSTAQGNVTEVYVKPGSKVKMGEILADIFNPYIEENLHYLEKRYHDNGILLNNYRIEFIENKNKLTEQFKQKNEILKENLIDSQEKTNTLNNLFLKKKELFKKHYLTIPELEKAKEAYLTAKNESNKVLLELNDLPLKLKEAQNDLNEKMNQYLTQYEQSKHEFEVKHVEKQTGTKIISPIAGTIIGSNISPGDSITAGKTTFTLITTHPNDSLDALVFINHEEGKKISAGMEAYILPNTISEYKYGYIKGKVIHISDYPASKESVYAYLGNTSLVDEFFIGGAPFMANIQLTKNNKTATGLSWTTRKGPPFKIEAGTPVSVKIINKKGTPLTLLTRYE